MRSVKKFLALFFIIALAMLACSVTVDLGTQPSTVPTRPLSGLEQVSTMVAQTLQAFTQEALTATTANTPLPTVTATPRNTPVPPTLTVSADTNCYAGPSTGFGFVITLHPGTIAVVIGKDTANNYWIIDVPNYPGTTCWLSGQYATLTGDTSYLAGQPTPAIVPYTLSEPRALHVSCHQTPVAYPPPSWWHSSSAWTVVFSWKNTDNDQTGIRVYRNGWRIAMLGGRATSYTDTFIRRGWHWDEDITYGVQAFTSDAISSIVTITVYHCS
jgi:hypothetical protein